MTSADGVAVSEPHLSTGDAHVAAFLFEHASSTAAQLEPYVKHRGGTT